MAANFAWARADVRDGDTLVYERQSVVVRNGKLTVSNEQGPVLIRTGVTAVRTAGRSTFTVEFAEGTPLTVERAGCGCGGRQP